MFLLYKNKCINVCIIQNVKLFFYDVTLTGELPHTFFLTPTWLTCTRVKKKMKAGECD